MSSDPATSYPAERGSAAGTGVWIVGGLAFALLLPLLVSRDAVAALSVLEIELPGLAVLGLDVAGWLRGRTELAIWCGAVVIASLPGWRLRRPGVQRCYLAAGLAVLAATFVLAFAVHRAIGSAHAVLGD